MADHDDQEDESPGTFSSNHITSGTPMLTRSQRARGLQHHCNQMQLSALPSRGLQRKMNIVRHVQAHLKT